MGEIYKAEYRDDPRGKVLEVLYPSLNEVTTSSFLQFRLADEAEVYPLNKIIAARCRSGWRKTSWGKLKEDLLIPADEEGEVIGIVVERGVWECDPERISLYIEELKGRIRGRNRQIEDLREELAVSKKR